MDGRPWTAVHGQPSMDDRSWTAVHVRPSMYGRPWLFAHKYKVSRLRKHSIVMYVTDHIHKGNGDATVNV